MIEFKNVSFAYGDNVILQKFNFSVQENQITAILGASGCGKTTLLNLIAGALKPQDGELIASNKVSYVFQEPRLINEKTVFANLDFILKPIYNNKTERRQIIMEGLEKAGLKDSHNFYPHQLSGGMAQRVSLLRAFLFPSKILLLDEPFKGLDEEIKKSIIETFLNLYRTSVRTIVIVTHDQADAHQLAHTTVVVEGKPLIVQEALSIDLQGLCP